MMMHKPYCPKIMTENLRGGLRPGTWGPGSRGVEGGEVRDLSQEVAKRMPGQGSLQKGLGRQLLFGSMI